MPGYSTRMIPDCYVKVLLGCTGRPGLGMWEKPPGNANACTCPCSGVLGIYLGMAGAHWPVLLQLQPAGAGAVQWGVVGWARKGTFFPGSSCIALVSLWPGTYTT